ncbi:MAG TPA: hypothetical protein VF590_13410, partial [Isosphaeraceae bacterium]
MSSNTNAKDAKNCPYCGIHFSLDGVSAYNGVLNFEGFRPWSGARREAGIDPAKPLLPWTSYTTTSHLCPSCKGKIIWL